MTIIFTRPHYKYQPYGDLYRIIELSGFPLVYFDEVDWQQPDTVIMVVRNGEAEGIPMNRRANLIHWMLERPRPDADEMSRINYGVDDIWASDTLLAEQVSGTYVFLGGIETFAPIDFRQPELYDLIGLMYWSPRRWTLRNALLEAGLSLADPDGDCWDETRDRLMARSRLVINAHQDDYPWCEPIKFAISAMYGRPLLSETSDGSGLWENGYHYIGRPYAELVEWARYLLTDEVALRRLAANAWRLVCREHPFRRCVLEAAGEAVAE